MKTTVTIEPPAERKVTITMSEENFKSLTFLLGHVSISKVKEIMGRFYPNTDFTLELWNAFRNPTVE